MSANDDPNETFLTEVGHDHIRAEDSDEEKDPEDDVGGDQSKDGQGAQSPNYQSDPEKGFTMDIMMMLDKHKVSSLRKEFEKVTDGLSMSDFVYVMKQFLAQENDKNSPLYHMEEAQLVSNLCELFAQIDINGDGTMEWDEFTSFIVETGLTSRDHQPNAIQLYHPSGWQDSYKHSQFIENIYYFPEIDKIVTCEHASKSLKVYSPGCELLRRVTRPEGIVLCAGYIHEMNQYVVASSDLQLSFYDELSFRLTKSFHTPTSQLCMTWSPESQTLFSAGVSGVVYAWDAYKMEEKHHMGGAGRDGRLVAKSHQDIVLDLLPLESLESLASASMDKTIRLWDIHTGKHKQKLEGHTKGVRSLAYSLDYRFLVSAGFDYDALVWNPYVDHLILRLHGHTSSLCGVEIIPNTPQIITADTEGVFKVWDIRNFSCLQTFTAENVADTRSFASITPHKRLVSVGRMMHIFDYEKLENPELTDDNPIFAALFNPTSMTFITAAGHDVKVWDARYGSLIRVYRSLSNTDLTALCLDFRERKFITGDHSGGVKVFDYLNGAEMKRFEYAECGDNAHMGEVSKLIYCNAHQTVLSTSWDLSICVHDERDPEKGVLLRRMSGGHSSDITALAYSSNLSLIASGSSDCGLQIWDFEFGSLESSCIGHCSGITCLLFLDPYPALIAADSNGNLAVWALRPSQFKQKCLFRWQNKRTRQDAPCPAVSMGRRHTWSGPCTCADFEGDPEASIASSTSSSATAPLIGCSGRCGRHIVSYLLYVGDERGYITTWDLLPSLLGLRDLPFVPLRTPFPCSNPRRNLRYDAADVLRKLQNGPDQLAFSNGRQHKSFFDLPGSPLGGINSVLPPRSWSAHQDAIYSLQVIEEPPSILTASFDRLVRVFSLDGEALGTLRQGDGNRKRAPWNFVVDVERRQKKKMQMAGKVIYEMSQSRAEAEAARQQQQQQQGRAEGNVFGDSDSGGSSGSRGSDSRSSYSSSSSGSGSGSSASSSTGSSSSGTGSDMTGSESAASDGYDVLKHLKEESVHYMDQLANVALPPERRAEALRARASTYRRTPRLKPIDARNAGKGLSGTPQGLQKRVVNRK